MATITVFAAVLLHMQAASAARVLERQRQTLVRSVAAEVGTAHLSSAVDSVMRGRTATSVRRLDTRAGVLEVAVETSRRDGRTSVVQVRVTDALGRVLQTYETTVGRAR